jgi:hypothetical protein
MVGSRKAMTVMAVTLVLLLVNATLAWSNDQGKYAATGLNDAASFDRFYSELRTAVLKDDRQKVISLWAYPMVFPMPGNKTESLRDKVALLKDYDIVFTKDVKAAFERTDLSKITWSYAGFRVGDGEMWIRPAGIAGRFFISHVDNAQH